MEKEILSNNLDETKNIANILASCFKGGEVLFFSGPIGAGKTIMVKEIASYFGFKKRPTSASFSLMKKYQNKNITLYHADLFRLNEGEMFNLGFEEMLEDNNALLLIEWPKPAEQFFPKDRLEITLTLLEDTKRKITLKTGGKVSERLLGDLCKHLNKKVKI